MKVRHIQFCFFKVPLSSVVKWTGFALLVNVMSFTRHQSSHPFQISATFRSPLFKMPNNACNDVAIAPKKIHLLVFCFRRSSPLSLSIRYLEVGTESYRSVRCSIVRYRRDCDTYNMIIKKHNYIWTLMWSGRKNLTFPKSIAYSVLRNKILSLGRQCKICFS